MTDTATRVRRAASRPVVIRYDASRDQECSRDGCGRAISKGDPAGFNCTAGPKPICGPCCDELEVAAGRTVEPAAPSLEDDLGDPKSAVEPATEPERDGPAPSAAAFDAELAQIAGTDTCQCTGKRAGFTNAGGPGDAEWWVCIDCSKPTRPYAERLGLIEPEPAETAQTDPNEGETTAHDEPADAADGAAQPAGDHDDAQPAAEPGDDGSAAGDGGDGTAAPVRGRARARQSTRRGRRGVGAAETAARRAGGEGEDAQRLGQGADDRGEPAGDDERRAAQPAPSVPDASAPGGELAGRHEGDEAGRPGDVRQVGDEVGGLADGPGEVADEQPDGGPALDAGPNADAEPGGSPEVPHSGADAPRGDGDAGGPAVADPAPSDDVPGAAAPVAVADAAAGQHRAVGTVSAPAFAAPPAPSDLPVPDAPVVEQPGRLAAFMAAAPVGAISGNSPFASRYAAELRQIVADYANGSARNMQRHLGPSEIGHACHRQVAGKLAQLDHVNNVSDPWPSIMGTAGHAWMEDCLKAANTSLGRIRFLTEYRVTPTMGFEGHPGTGDGYDAEHEAVIDHKFLGDTSMGKVRKGGPPRHYFVQFLLYALGFMALGLPVRRIVLLAWPRTGSSLDGLYVWEHEVTDADIAFLRDVVEPELRYRKAWAAALLTGAAKLSDVPADTADECHFCPFYRPQTANDGGPGCAGDAVKTPAPGPVATS